MILSNADLIKRNVGEGSVTSLSWTFGGSTAHSLGQRFKEVDRQRQGSHLFSTGVRFDRDGGRGVRQGRRPAGTFS